MEVKLDIEIFRKIIDITGNRVYESENSVVSVDNGLIIYAEKKNTTTPAFKDSIPMDIGYMVEK